MKVHFLPFARDELQEAIDYYEDQQIGLGERLNHEFWAAIEKIQAHPTACQRVTVRVRRCLLHHFPYGIVFTIQPDHILIIAIMHLHRRPGYWRSRL